ncbi:MAG: 2-dehydropantoate 2-reductase [Akkermansiaceae bacterium]
MKSFAIVGAGAVGSYYGGRLAAAGHDVCFLLRSDYEVVKENGLTVESIDGDFYLPEVNCFRTPEEVGPVDVVIVAWKATSNHLFEKVIHPMLHEETAIVTLQNGLGNTEALGELFGIERVLGAMCFVCINRIEAGLIRHTGGGMIAMGEAVSGMTDRLRELAAIFESANVFCKIAEDFGETQWRKLVWNIPFNGLCITEGGIDTGKLLAMPAGEDRVRELMLEVTSSAAALGFVIENEFVEFQIERTYPMNDYRPSSMIDFVKGYPVEVEAIWGEPLRRAQAAGVPTPKMEALDCRIRELLKQR